jgi:FkbH-like protein
MIRDFGLSGNIVYSQSSMTAMANDTAQPCDANFLIISDFNAQNLAALLSNSKSGPSMRANAAPFGQVMQILLSPHSEVWTPHHTAAIVWTSPQAVSQGYGDALRFEPIRIDRILAEVEQFARALLGIPTHIKHIFVPTWAARHPLETRRGLLDMNPHLGLSAALLRMNLRLTELVAEDSRIHLFDSSRWMALHGERSYDPRLWYLAKTPYCAEVFKEAACDFAAALRALTGRARKLIILDLDDTLWGGTVGDVGWRRLRLGGHDPIGEAYRDFQAALKALTRRGILLAIASKNEEHAALEAISNHPEMILTLDDFAGWRINWNDKVSNIADLVSDLNLGLGAAVFIDDNPMERARARETLSELLVPEWPRNPVHYVTSLARLDCFDTPIVSAEDRNRTATYVSERKRRQLQSDSSSPEAWLRTLDLTVRVENLDEGNLERTIQLFNKTNQMNLRTRRLSRRELADWASARDHRLLVFRVADKFGDYGLTGIASLRFERAARTAHIEDCVLSCRVMGRKVEDTMIHVLTEQAKAEDMVTMVAEYTATLRNQPCLRFFETSSMARDRGGECFHWDLVTHYPLPDFVSLIKAEEVKAQRRSEPLETALR